MTCKNCGAPILERQSFCAACGASLTGEPARAPMDTAPVEEVAAPGTFPGTAETSGETAKPEKRKLGWIIALAAAVAVIAGVALGWGYIGNFIDRTFLSPADYYHKVEKRALHAETGEFSRSTRFSVIPAGLFSGEKADRATRGSMTITAGEALRAMLTESAGIDMSWLESAGLSFVMDGTREKMFGAKCSLQLNGTDIIGLDGMYDRNTYMGYFRVPELSTQYASVNAEEFLSDYYWNHGADSSFQLLSSLVYGQESDAPNIFSAIPSPDVLSSLMDRYGAIIVDGLTDVTRGKESIVAEGVKGTYTVLTVKADRAALEKILRDVLTTAANDAELKGIIANFTTQMGEDGEAAYASFQEAVRDILEEEMLIEDDVNLKMKLYVDGKGEIHGRHITVTSAGNEIFMLGYLFPVDGSRFGLSLQAYAAGGDRISVIGSGTTRKDNIKGTFTLYVAANGSTADCLTADVDASFQGGTFHGEITLAFTETSKAHLTSLLHYSDVPRELHELIRDMKLRIVNHSAKDKVDVKLALVNGEAEFLALLVEASPTDAMDLTVPADAVDAENWAGSINQLSLMTLIGNLQEAGLPLSFLSELGGLS